MPWSGASGSQTYTRSDGVRSGTDVYAQQKAAGIDIVAAQHDATEQDLATAVNLTLKKDGGNKPTANIDWGAFRLTNLGAPTADNDAIRRAYAEDHLVLISSELTISSGAVTPTRSRHTIDTESDASTDNLDQIVTTNMRTGQVLELFAENSARIVTVRNAQGVAGEIHTRGNRSITLSTENPLILQLVDGTDWYEILSTDVQPVLLGTLDASNDASLDFTTLMTTDHAWAELKFQNLVPATDAVNLYIRVADSGTTWSTTGYNWSRHASINSGVGGITGGSSVARWEVSDISVGSAGVETGVSGSVKIYKPMVASYTHMIFHTESMGADALFYAIHGGGVIQESLTHESVQLLYSSGNIESGQAQLWGHFL